MAKYIKIEDAAKAFSIQTPYCYQDCYDDLVRGVLNGIIEAEDVAPVVHAKWVVGEADFGFSPLIQKTIVFPKYTCKKCGYDTGKQAEEFAFCPICGAKMDL